jgi:pimeloyl-[acyl-carrier protein] methyl ester esterase
MEMEPPPRLVLLHALPFDGRMWQAERDLAPGGTAIVPTLYRFGESLEEWARGFLDLVGDEPLVVVGCSVGGSVALEIARAAPDQVQGIVLVGAKAGVRPDPAFRDDAVRLLTRHGLEAGWDAYWRPLFSRNAPKQVVASAREIALEQDVADIVRGVRAFHDRRDLTDFAQAWRGPIVIISGDQDRTPSPASAAATPNRAFHLVEDCGHYVSLERAAEFWALVTRAAKKMGTSA